MGVELSAGRLRGELTDFVGRRAELALIRQALGTARLVTLTGPGGIGKTRLALQTAEGARRAFRDGACLAELGGLRDPALLVLDQCEHLADACAVMADTLLRACPGLRIIATSRHVLRVTGEVTLTVPPMTVPSGPASTEELLGYEAVRLFVSRAAAVLPGFIVDASNGAAVVGICRALDGIPLALELAAVRLRSSQCPGQGLTCNAARGRRTTRRRPRGGPPRSQDQLWIWPDGPSAGDRPDVVRPRQGIGGEQA